MNLTTQLCRQFFVQILKRDPWKTHVFVVMTNQTKPSRIEHYYLVVVVAVVISASV